jgi:hypothetical protein
MSDSTAETGFTIEPATIDQAAGALALSLGALGSLLLVIWQSKCRCRCRIGLSDQLFCFDCTREPPPVDEEDPGDEQLVPTPTTAKPQTKKEAEPEPEPQPEPEPEPEPQPDDAP